MKIQRDRGLSNSEIARRAGISQARISQVISGDNPTADLCLLIAKGLNVSPEDALRSAGYLPVYQDSAILQQIYDIVRHLNDTERKNVLDYVLWRLQKQGSNQT